MLLVQEEVAAVVLPLQQLPCHPCGEEVQPARSAGRSQQLLSAVAEALLLSKAAAPPPPGSSLEKEQHGS